jgi:hypothetical protein
MMANSFDTFWPSRVPQLLFCANVLLHQCGDDLVLLNELGPQPGDFLLLDGKPLGLAFGNRVKGDRRVIKEDLLSG